MIGRTRSLPLGVDVGASRVRMAHAVLDADGEVRVRAVAARDRHDDGDALLVALLEEMLAELGTRERRCAISITSPHSALRIIEFPNMTWAERSRAARFEAERFIEWDTKAVPTAVRSHVFDRERRLYAVGAVKVASIATRRRVLRDAGLRTAVVDDDAFALQRALPFADAVVDIGLSRSTLHVFDRTQVRSTHIPLGGMLVTQGIAADLKIDEASAERRKRILGCAGSGTTSRDDLVRAIAEAIERARMRSAITRVALTGNGSRLPGLGIVLEAATGAIVDSPVSDYFPSDIYPADVLRSAAPDWTLAVALSVGTVGS